MNRKEAFELIISLLNDSGNRITKESYRKLELIMEEYNLEFIIGSVKHNSIDEIDEYFISNVGKEELIKYYKTFIEEKICSDCVHYNISYNASPKKSFGCCKAPTPSYISVVEDYTIVSSNRNANNCKCFKLR
jgi:hypothetical protein